MKYLILFLSMFLVTACALDPVERGQGYMLALQSYQAEGATSYRPGQVMIDYPVTDPVLDTYRVAVLRENGVLDYYSGTRWADFLPLLVQNNIKNTLSGAEIFTGVVTDRSGALPDYRLEIRIDEFQAEYETAGTPPEINVSFEFTLRRPKLKTRPKTFHIRDSVTAKANTIPAIHDAFKTAFTNAQKQLVSAL